MASSRYGCDEEGRDAEGTARDGDEVMVKPPGLRMPVLAGGYRSTH